MTGLTRRTLLAAALLGTSGCSLLPSRGGGDDLAGLLSRIGLDALGGEGELARIGWGRPAAAREALGIEPGATWNDLGGVPWTDIFFQIDARLMVSGGSALLPTVPSEWLGSPDRLYAPTAMVTVDQGRAGAATLWTGVADLLGDYQRAFGSAATREGDTLVLEGERIERTVVAAIGEDLVATTAPSADDLDGRPTAESLYEDLDDLLALLELENAHLMTSVIRPADDGAVEAYAREAVVATRFESSEEHASRGVLRAEGDAAELAQRLLDPEELQEGQLVAETAEVDGQLISVGVSSSDLDAYLGTEALELLHRSFLPGMTPERR